MKEKRKRQANLGKSCALYGLAFLFMFVGVMLTPCISIFSIFTSDNSSYKDEDAKLKISNELSPLPMSVFNLYFEKYGLIDRYYEMRFSIPISDAAEWLMMSGLCFPLPQHEISHVSYTNPHWWQLENAVDGRLKTTCEVNAYTYTVDVDISQANYWSFLVSKIDY